MQKNVDSNDRQREEKPRLGEMFRPRHFASREENYPRLVRALVPYVGKIVEGRAMEVANIVAPLLWKNLTTEKRRKLRMFILQNEQTILQHIAEVKENKDAVIVHKTVRMLKKFFENVAVAMIPHKEYLKLEQRVPMRIVETVYKIVDGPRMKASRLSSLQGYLLRNREKLLKRIQELDEEAAKEKSNLQKEPKPPEEKNSERKDDLAASLARNQQADEIRMEPKVASPAKSSPLPSRKRYREEAEPESKTKTADDEEFSPAPAPCAKRRRLTIDDLEFARWCLRKIRPIFCA